jgi:cell division protein FtsI/penicillin-binding protein 2
MRGARWCAKKSRHPRSAPRQGKPLKTTIDLPLQVYVDSLWGDSIPYRGALVAMNPKGEILALYSWPSFDPNNFVGGISGQLYRDLTSDSAGLPLYNRAIKGSYPPASPFKLATAAMALRRGIVTFSTHMEQPCRGGFRFGSRVFKCWKKEGHGSLDLTGAIAASCDVYFYQLGLKLGLDHLLEDGIAMGFRDRSGIDLGSESRSFYPRTKAWYDSTYGPRGWTNAVTLKPLHRAGRRQPDPHQHDEVLPGTRRRREDGAPTPRRGAEGNRVPDTRARRGPARGTARRDDRGRAAWHRRSQRRQGSQRGRQDRDGAKPARRRSWLVHRIRPGGQARDHRGQHHGEGASWLVGRAVGSAGHPALPGGRREAHRRADPAPGAEDSAPRAEDIPGVDSVARNRP